MSVSGNVKIDNALTISLMWAYSLVTHDLLPGVVYAMLTTLLVVFQELTDSRRRENANLLLMAPTGTSGPLQTAPARASASGRTSQDHHDTGQHPRSGWDRGCCLLRVRSTEDQSRVSRRCLEACGRAASAPRRSTLLAS